MSSRTNSDINKHIESEYLSMVDQLVMACDENLTILYNNYHERYYESIVLNLEGVVNPEALRVKRGGKLDKCFVSEEKSMQADEKTLQSLYVMMDDFGIVLSPEDIETYFKKKQSQKVVNFILARGENKKKKAETTPESSVVNTVSKNKTPGLSMSLEVD